MKFYEARHENSIKEIAAEVKNLSAAAELGRCIQKVDETLIVLFEKRKDGRSFAFHELLPMIVEQMEGAEVEAVLFSILQEPEILKRRLFLFHTGKTIPADIVKIANLLDVIDLSPRMKCHLLGFCSYPESVLQSFVEALEMIKEPVKRLRGASRMISLALEKQIGKKGIQGFMKQLNEIPGYRMRWETKRDLLVAFSVVDPYLLKQYAASTAVMLGIRYEKTLEDLRTETKGYDLIAILHALGDTHRSRMIKELQRTGGAHTISEMSDVLEESINTVQYHMSVLVQCGLVKIRKGKNKQFYLNEKFCRYASRDVGRLLGQEKELTIEEKLRGQGALWWNQ